MNNTKLVSQTNMKYHYGYEVWEMGFQVGARKEKIIVSPYTKDICNNLAESSGRIAYNFAKEHQEKIKEEK